ncbi:hypothetical protein QT972_33010, partial [Microcoleus sp. herbarium7]
MTFRSQKLFLLAGIFGLVLLGKPAKTSASAVEILTSNVEDLAAVGSGGDTNLEGREDLDAADAQTHLPAGSEAPTPAETANSADRGSDIMVENRQDACSTRSELSCGVGILPARTRLSANVTSDPILKNRQDACSTRSEFSCGTGILPA